MFYILSSADIIFNFANGLYPDQVRQYIGRDSDPNCLAFRLHFRKGYFNHLRIDSSRKKKKKKKKKKSWSLGYDQTLSSMCHAFMKTPFQFLRLASRGRCLWTMLGFCGLSNRIDPDKMPHMGASPQGQHRLYVLNLILF